jgi:heme A synthase
MTHRPVPLWLHAWAVLTAVAATAAVTMGAVVTTFRVGMADPVWPTYPWHLLLISWQEPSAGYLIEHGHRLAAYIAGFCVTVLAVLLWLRGSRPLALLAFACVLGQGLLGGVRVLFNAVAGPELAAVHGCFAQAVLALIVGLAAWTAPGRLPELPSAEYARRCRRTALGLAGLVFLQLVWGAIVRHTHDAAAQRMHILTAFVVVGAVVWLLKVALEQPAGLRLLRWPLVALAVLLVVQLNLGIEAWMGLFASELPPEAQPLLVGQAVVRTAHVVVGAGILAASAVAAIQAHRAVTAVAAEQPHVEALPQTGIRPAASPLVAAASHQLKGTA